MNDCRFRATRAAILAAEGGFYTGKVELPPEERTPEDPFHLDASRLVLGTSDTELLRSMNP